MVIVLVGVDPMGTLPKSTDVVTIFIWGPKIFAEPGWTLVVTAAPEGDETTTFA